MPTKSCAKCGWELDLYDKHNNCPICGTAFEDRICSKCGALYKRWSMAAGRTLCPACYYKSKYPNRDEMTSKYINWLDKVSRVPADYPRLSEEQWLKAAQHFGHCAMCKDETIDTRMYFIPFKDGGRYCDWNIIPVCSKCATKARKQYNYFIICQPIPGLDDIVEYLEEKLDGAVGEN